MVAGEGVMTVRMVAMTVLMVAMIVRVSVIVTMPKTNVWIAGILNQERCGSRTTSYTGTDVMKRRLHPRPRLSNGAWSLITGITIGAVNIIVRLMTVPIQAGFVITMSPVFNPMILPGTEELALPFISPIAIVEVDGARNI